jgi:hypothetical protein
MYTNESVFDFFDIVEGDEMRNSSQLSATILIMKKNDHCLNLIDEFYKISESNPVWLYREYPDKQKQSKHRLRPNCVTGKGYKGESDYALEA